MKSNKHIVFSETLVTVIVKALDFASGYFLFRLLLPEDFGYMALASSYLGISEKFISGGMSTEIMIKGNEKNLRRYNSTALLIYFGISIISFVISCIAYIVLDNLILFQVMLVLSMSTMFKSFQVVGVSYITLQKNAVMLGICVLAIAIVRIILSLYFAHKSLGPLAIPLAVLGSSIASGILYFSITKFQMDFPKLKMIRNNFKLRKDMTLARLIQVLNERADYLVAQWFMPVSYIGILNKAKELPLQVRPILGKPMVTLTQLRLRQEEEVKLRPILYQHLCMIILFSILIIFGKNFVLLYMGTGWELVAFYIPLGASVLALRLTVSLDSYFLYYKNQGDIVVTSLLFSLMVKVLFFVFVYQIIRDLDILLLLLFFMHALEVISYRIKIYNSLPKKYRKLTTNIMALWVILMLGYGLMRM